MSVNSKMTAIADLTRTLTGKTEKMGLDAMKSNLSSAVNEVDTQDDLIQQIKTALQGKATGGADPVIEPLEVTENGTYTAPNGVDGYSPVTVNVPVPDGYIKPSGELEITENGTHDVTVYQSVNVNVDRGAGGVSDLPAGYRRVDYIQLTGDQIVDTGIICNQNTKIRLALTRERSTQHYLYGVSSSDNTASVTAYLGGSWRYGNKAVTKTLAANKDMIYSAVVDSSQVTLTGSASTISSVNEFETIGTLLIGTCRSAGGTVGEPQFVGKIFFFAMYQGDEQVQHLVPVTDGTIYRFWDTVSETFFDSITDVPLEGGNV